MSPFKVWKRKTKRRENVKNTIFQVFNGSGNRDLWDLNGILNSSQMNIIV